MKRWIIIGLCIICDFVKAQEHYVFSPITTIDGLSENTVRCIDQLSDGRMAIVTDGVINLYDGASFRYLHYNAEKMYRLSGYSGFHHTYVDAENRFWVKARQRLMLFDINKETFIENPDSVLQKEGINASLSDFFMDSDRGLWFLSCDDELLYRGVHEEKAIVYIPEFSQLAGKNDDLYDLAVCRKQLFLFFKSGLMICFNLETKEELFRENPLKMGNEEIYNRTSLVISHEQYLYQIRNGNSGILLRYDVNARKWETILKQDYTFNTLSVDKEGNLWISSSRGLCYIRSDLEKKQYIPELQLVDGAVLKVGINTQYSDIQGGFWIGTAGNGMLYYHPDRFKFKNIKRTLFKTSKDDELNIHCFVKKDSSILVGTSHGLFLYSGNQSTLSLFPKLPLQVQCNWLMTDRNQRTWICTENDGLYCIDGEKIKHYTFPFHSINYIHETDQGLYVCTNSGFGLFDPLSGDYEPAISSSVYQLIDYGKEAFAGLSNAGLFIYNYKERTLHISNNETKDNPLLFHQSNHHYNCLFADSRGFIWSGTQDGLNVLDAERKELRNFRTENGLLNNCIQSIIEDDRHRIWVSTSYGISCIEIAGDTYFIKNYNLYDGVIHNEFVRRSSYHTGNVLFWGGVDGFNEMNLNDSLNKERVSLVPLFVKFFLNGNEIKHREEYHGRTLFQQSISSTKELKLRHNQNFFTFEFSALNYINPTQTYYRYQLEGVDDSRHETITTNGLLRINYTNVPPGAYTLKVYAANNDMEWNDECVEIKIVIMPPFWKTSIAYMLYGLISLLVIYVAAHFYLQWNKKKLERRQKEDLDQMKFRFFTNISHELRTPLSLIITPLETLLKKTDNEKIKRQLTDIVRNAHNLLNMVNQLLDFRKIEMDGDKLQRNGYHINELVDFAGTSFLPMAENKEIEFVCIHNVSNIYASVDKDKLLKIVNNLLSNAYKFTPPGGTITLILDQKDCVDGNYSRMFSIKVTDTGCGIPKKDIPNIFDRFYQVADNRIQNTGSGIGLHIVYEYVQLHNGHIQVESDPGKGSSFTVYIPYTPLHSEEATDIEKKIIPEGNSVVRILVVDDNEDFRSFLCDCLSEHYTTIPASNGKDGLEKAIELLPEIIISDVMMPVMNGIEFCKNLRNDIRISHTLFIMLTARSSEEAQMEGYEVGADAYISKPFNMDILLLRIHNLIELQQQRKQMFKEAVETPSKYIALAPIDEELINKAIHCIETNMSNSLYSVEQFSKDMYMDRTGLYRKLLAVTGLAPSAFIRSIRLKRAAQLLDRQIPVSDVSELVGFGTVSYFSKCFHEEFGVKPSLYRSRNISQRHLL
ncbi:MAG: response regulator [Tannerella sp.]|jgi:signal transduction histidine kinase/ligand-binding sensor domain-containing protein/AraC-like DNA-binding protein|nr:response regulator [Tannerella sp.]